MKLKKFKNMNKQKKVVIGSILGILLIIGSIALYRSYALYEEKKEFNVIRGVVPDFGYDIKMLSIVVDEEKVDTIPSKPETGSYKVDVTCDKGIGEWDYKNWKLSLSEFEKETRCMVTFTRTDEELVEPSSESTYTITIPHSVYYQEQGSGKYLLKSGSATYKLTIKNDGTYSFVRTAGSNSSGGSGFKTWNGNVQMYSEISVSCKKNN